MTALDELEKKLERIRKTRGFLEFVHALDARVGEGQTLPAFRMLTSLGAPQNLAHQILEGWPASSSPAFEVAGVSRELEAAVRFAHFIDKLEAYNWPAVLRTALAREASARARDPR